MSIFFEKLVKENILNLRQQITKNKQAILEEADRHKRYVIMAENHKLELLEDFYSELSGRTI